MADKRICVIGAGPAGMSVMYRFAQLGEMPEIVCFEKQSTWGGMWNFTWKTGVDENGEPVSESMYKNLWINGPKENIEFPDYTYEEHFGRITPSFAPRPVIRSYLEGRWTKAAKVDLKKYIRFNTNVRFVKYSDDTSTFTVTVEDHANHETREEVFTHVIVSAGIFSFPNLPDFQGLNVFEGRILHSHDFRDAREFKGQRVLLIGAGYTGEDIALQMVKYGAKRTILCYRGEPKSKTAILPKEVEEKPIVERFDAHAAYFTDGTSAELDAVILTTGYRMYFPFLENRLRIPEENHLYPQGLYKGSVFFKHGGNRLFFVGVQNLFSSFVYYETIANWICKFIMGELKGEPKSPEEMNADYNKWFQKAGCCKSEADVIGFQDAIIKDLVELADYPFPDIFKMTEDSYKLFRMRREGPGLAKVKDIPFRSVFTGKMAAIPSKPFMEQYDESIEAFVNND